VERTITLSQAANYLFPAPTAMKPVGVVAKVARELPAFDLEVTSGSSVNLYRWESGANRAYRNVRLAGTFSGSVKDNIHGKKTIKQHVKPENKIT